MHYNHSCKWTHSRQTRSNSKRQTEITEKVWEGRKVVQIPNEWMGNWQGAFSLTWWWPWWYSPPQCRELHSELDNLSDEYLSCLRTLQHCREELNQSQQLPPRVRAWSSHTALGDGGTTPPLAKASDQPVPFSLLYTDSIATMETNIGLCTPA